MDPQISSAPSDRDLRQRSLVPPKRLAGCDAVVVGVGAIGRQVALQLAALGAPWITLFDHDVVDVVNLAPQGYRPDQIALRKAGATAFDCQLLNPLAHVVAKAERFRRSSLQNLEKSQNDLAVFACVDAIGTRRLIWDSVCPHASFFVDGRMSAEVIRVLAVSAPADNEYYPSTLFSADEAYVGSCTARSTIYAASVAAGLMVGQFTKWLRHLPIDADLTLNLLATELTVQGGRDLTSA
jgi:molybdopterin-synthase adenylyltransferase